MVSSVKEVMEAVDTSALMTRSLIEWRPVLSVECQVYVFGENYLAKRFDQINYKFCEKQEAKEILVDNLYALLRYKYFTRMSDEVDERINKIVSSFTTNLKTTLLKVSFDDAADCMVMKQLPDYCIAFRNGVYNFRDNKWYFKYDIVKLERLNNKIYLYDNTYAIMWYLDYDFDPLPFSIMDVSLEDFVEMMKEITKTNRNYCFELLYNIAHESDDHFSKDKFVHLCEVLGYTMLQSFSQHFVMLIGSGQNGKNSLFDGCFIHRVVPRPASNDLDAIEGDRFITGALENKAHNIFLETSAKTYTESKMIKALTGSMYQTIESKGVSKYSSVINCKYVFAGNDQEKIKFSDNTTGFRRRINMLEIYYHWDAAKKFMKRGDYYDTTFSDSLYELKNDVANTTAYVYFAMYGILIATKQFKDNFKFTINDWNNTYTDGDVDIKEKIDRITMSQIINYINSNDRTKEEGKSFFFDINRTRLYLSKTVKDFGCSSYEDMIKMFSDDELFISYFSEYDIYMSVKGIQSVIRDYSSPTTFTQMFKKLFMLDKLEMMNGNKPYIKITFVNNKLKILK